MGATVAYATATWGATSAIGAHYGVGRFDAQAVAVPIQQESAHCVSYTVPPGEKLVSPTILAVADRPWAGGNSPTAQAGVARLRVNGVDVAEWACYETGWLDTTGFLAYKCEQRRGGGFHLFGCDFAAGAVLVLRFTGTSAVARNLVSTALTGVASGATVCTSDRRVIPGSNPTDCITYTVPAGGFTLKRVCLQARTQGTTATPFISLALNGQLIVEAPTWRATDAQGTPPCIRVPLQGVTLYPGDVISLDGSSLWRMGESIHLTVLGRSASLAGGGNTYSRGRVVNA